jgi:hypothetical protein
VRLTRVATLLLAGLVILDLIAVSATIGVLQSDPLRAAAAGLGDAKVAIIVGPVGSLTDYYRGLADDAAAAARRLTDNVVIVYSPNATWPVVRRAMQGASIVVYLGHGNGWPSPYRDSLNRASEDGLGLNPVGGVDDDAHQYFGEAAIAKGVRLAPGAVVLLHHLCYASGAGEPGMPNPSLDVASQRVDNYGAGWLAAGASAVVAEAHFGPAYYVTALLKEQGTPEQIWRAAPTSHGHVIASASVRTPGAQVFLDPDLAHSGYYKSLVTLPDAAARALAPGGPGSLVAPGARPALADLLGPTVAASVDRLIVTFDSRTVPLLPDQLDVGTRWTRIGDDGGVPLEPDAVDSPGAPGPGVAAGGGGAPARGSSGSVGASRSPSPGGGGKSAATAKPDATAKPSASPTADASAALAASPADSATDPQVIDLVVPEAPGSLIATAPASGSGRQRTVNVSLPGDPGVYRLVATLHDADGVAYDAATQALVPALIVHVTGRIWVSYGAPDQVSATAGQPLSVSIRVANTGSQDWGPRPLGDVVDPEPAQPDPQARVVGHWLHLDDGSSEGQPTDLLAGSTPVVDIVPGSSEVVDLAVQAPVGPGHYLLVVDLVTSNGLSLAAAGVPPALIRVVVAAPPVPDHVPTGRRS